MHKILEISSFRHEILARSFKPKFLASFFPKLQAERLQAKISCRDSKQKYFKSEFWHMQGMPCRKFWHVFSLPKF